MFCGKRCLDMQTLAVKRNTTLDILFLSNHNIHKSSYVLYFWTSDPLIDGFYYNISIKVPEAQKQRPHELLWILQFYEKSISNVVVFVNVCTYGLIFLG